MLEQRRQNGAANKRVGNGVGVRRAEAFSIPLRALPISTESIGRLLNSRNRRGHAKVDRIHGELPRQLELLPRVERSGRMVVGDVEIRNDTEDALLLFILDLGFGLLHW